ncbi:MAG: hypothetical protein ACFE9S_14625 [Candidatus Hermodarchaeota archaeon]
MTEIQKNQLEKIISNFSKIDPLKYIDGPKIKMPTQNSKIKIKYQHEPKIYRQGDILFKKIKNLPRQLKKKPDKVVAEGEETGHAHVLVNGALFELLNSEKLYLKSEQSTRIIHDEHLPIKLESGNYQVIRQREYLGPGLRTRLVRD